MGLGAPPLTPATFTFSLAKLPPPGRRTIGLGAPPLTPALASGVMTMRVAINADERDMQTVDFMRFLQEREGAITKPSSVAMVYASTNSGMDQSRYILL